nr:hypothetical protein [Tanacetum cinerariifolium]
MDMTIDQQVALDEDLAFLVTADVLEIYMQEFWATAMVYHHSIRHNEEIRRLTDVNINKLHQPWRSFAAIINKCLSGKSSGYDSLWLSQAQILWGSYHKRNVDFAYLLWEDFVYQVEHKDSKKSNEMYYPRFTKVIIHYFMSKDPSIPKRNKVNWHYVRDDQMFTTIKLTKASVRKTKSSSDTTVTPPPTAAAGTRLFTSAKGKQPAKASKAKSLTALFEVAMTEAEQLKLATKRSLQQTHISQASGSGTDEGTGTIPGVPDVPTEEFDEEISWKSSDKGDDDDDDDQEEGDDGDDQEEGNNDDQDSGKEGEEFIHPRLSIHDKEETRDEENFDHIPKTPKNTDDEVQQAPTPLTTAPSTLLQNLPNFGSLFGFDHRIKTLEDNFFEFVQTNQFDRLHDEAQADNEVFLKNLDENIQKIIKEQVKEQTSYAVAADLSEMELKKILIEKIEGNKSIHRSNEQRNLIKALVEAYESDKIILNTYGDTVTLKRRRDDDADKDEEPSAGSDRGSKRRREGKELESASAPKEKVTRSAGKSTQRSKSQQTSTSEFATAEEPMQTTHEMEELSHLEFEIGADDQPIAKHSQHPEWFSQQKKPLTSDRYWNKTLPATHGSIQPWISELAKQTDSRSSFNELMDTPVDFSSFLMNRLKVDTLTSELLAGPTYELMKGSCKSLIQESISYDKHALWGISHWGHKRQQFYEFAINRESARDVYSKRRIIAVTKLKIVEWHNYKHLDWITVRRDDDKLHKFKEGDVKRLRIQDIEDMLLLLVQGKLKNLMVEERFAFNVSLRMFTRSIVIQRRVDDLQIGVESYQKKLNLTRPHTYRSDLKRKEAYTAYSNPRGFIYQNKDKQNRLMQIDKLHKFSDGTLIDVRTALDDHVKGIRIKYLPEGGEHASASTPSEIATGSIGRSTTGSQSRQLSASESAFAEEPVQTTCQMEEPSHPPKRPPLPDRDWNKTLPAAQGDAQSWITPLPLIPDNRGRRVIPFDHFINNDLEYLRGGTSSRKYTTSVTKTKAADYGHIKWIEDLVPRAMWIQEPINYDRHALWGVSHGGQKHQQFYGFVVNRESALDVYSKRRIIAVTELQIMEWHNYKHLDWISVRRDDDKIYKFKEGDFKRLRLQDIEDMLLLLVQGKLSNLTVEEPSSESRPYMLNKENYVPWSSRLLWYAKSRPNRKLIHNSILNGPYVRKMIPEPGDANREITVTETFHLQTDDELSVKELKQIEADDQAIQTILLGSDIRIQEKKAKLFNEWERFTSNEGELIESYYHRFLKLMNDLKRNKHFSEKIASNLKFLNNLQPEWSRHVTIVHQTKDLHTDDYTQLYDFLKYNQKENYLQQPMPNPEDITDPTTAMNMALALMAKAFKLNYSTPTNNNQRISLNPRNRQIAQPGMNIGQDRQMQMVEGNGNQNQIGNGNLVAIRAKGNAAGQNGNHIRCYNCRGVGHYARNCTIRPKRRDAAYLQTQLLIAQKEEARIQLQAEEYDLMAAEAGNGSAEVHENCDDNEIFNMFTQEEQYTEILEPILESHQIPQNDNNVISEDTSVEQGEETVEQHPANFEETRTLYESLYQNLEIEVEKVNSVNCKLKETNADLTTELARYKNQERCFEISQEKYDKLERCYQQSSTGYEYRSRQTNEDGWRGVGHYARNYTIRPKSRDAAYLQTQLLIAQKEEARIQLQAEEYDLMATTAGNGSAKVHENCDDNEIFNMFTQEEQYTEILKPILESYQIPQNDNNVISEDTSVEQAKRRRLRKQAKEDENLKKQLDVVVDEDDDVLIEATPIGRKVPVVNYKIVMINNKPRLKRRVRCLWSFSDLHDSNSWNINKNDD